MEHIGQEFEPLPSDRQSSIECKPKVGLGRPIASLNIDPQHW